MTNRVRRDGKFFRLGDEKFYVKGVTYGPFAPNARRRSVPVAEQARKDFEQILELGANCVRIYHVPPKWFLDLAQEMRAEDLPRRRLAEEPDVRRRRRADAAGARRRPHRRPDLRQSPGHRSRSASSTRSRRTSCASSAREAVEEFVDELVAIAKAEAPRLPGHVRQLPDDRIPPAARRSTSSASTSTCTTSTSSAITSRACRTSPAKSR